MVQEYGYSKPVLLKDFESKALYSDEFIAQRFFSIEKKGIAVIRIRYNLFMYQKFKQLKKDKPYFYHFIMVMLLMKPWGYLIAVFFTLPYENGVLTFQAQIVDSI